MTPPTFETAAAFLAEWLADENGPTPTRADLQHALQVREVLEERKSLMAALGNARALAGALYRAGDNAADDHGMSLYDYDARFDGDLLPDWLTGQQNGVDAWDETATDEEQNQ